MLHSRLYALHADIDADGLRQLAHQLDKALGIGILRQIPHKALIHLDDIKGNLANMIQRRVSGSEIVQRNPHSKLLDPAQDLLHPFHIIDSKALRHLQGQMLRIQPRSHQSIVHNIHNIPLKELYHGQIHIYLIIKAPVIPFLALLAGL